MGASGWSYFVPYQADIKKAFYDLRQQVFERGRYYLLDVQDILPLSEDELVKRWSPPDDDPNDDHEEYREIYREYQERYSKPRPTTIEELLEWNQTEGTHTIMDIAWITDDPAVEDIMMATPLSEDQLLEFFGTTKPTRAMVEEKEDTLMGLRSRWQATYLIVYENDQPTEIFFTGFSGD